MMKPIVLVVEDDATMARLIQGNLKDESIDIYHAKDGNDALTYLGTQLPQVVLLDLNLPDMDGLDILRHITEQQIPTSVIVITGHASVDVAVKSMQAGAFDFLEKPFSSNRLTITLRNALERQNLTDTVDTIKDASLARFHGFIGSSIKMQAVYQIIDNAAISKASVFITGESGTGKEICAQAIHSHSPRFDKPFIAVNCASIPTELMESEVFGHIKGAFSGASSNRVGALASADGGTLFLDEICEMDTGLQAKLLRAIQMEEIKKVGSDKIEKVDVRFISATNREPLSEIKQGKLREDLYYRLNVIPIALPPLREHADDITELAAEFIKEVSNQEGKKFTGLVSDAESILLDYNWPGNVRQLKNIIQNIIVMNKGGMITPDMLPSPLDGLVKKDNAQYSNALATDKSPEVKDNATGESFKTLKELEDEYIKKVIDEHQGNIPQAAVQLGVSPSTIYRKIHLRRDDNIH